MCFIVEFCVDAVTEVMDRTLDTYIVKATAKK